MGRVRVRCFGVSDLADCEAEEMRIRRGHFGAGNILHEMAHVFTLTGRLPTHPGPLGIAQLYFYELASGGCDPAEILADMFALSVSGGLQLTYWGACNDSYSPAGTDPLTDKALAAVRSAVAGQAPQWFEDTYHDDAGDPDLEQVWTDLQSMPEGTYRSVAARLFRGEFGGYCDDGKVGEALQSGATVITNPWHDGGCGPEAPTGLSAVVGTDTATFSWTAPASVGGAPVEGYRLEWKASGEDYATSRRAVATDLSDLSHTVGGLAGGATYTFRVRAFNTLGDGAASAEVVVVPEGAPTIAGTPRAGRTLTVITSGIGDADGIDSATFKYQWVSSDGTTDTDIAGATSLRYRLTDDEVGKTIKVRVSFTDDADNEELRVSAATAEVEPRPNNRATGAPTIAGTARAGRTLAAITSDIADADGMDGATFRYQWVSNDGSTDTDISGATDFYYRLTDDEVGKTIKVRVSFTDDRGQRGDARQRADR